jgi:hypothetical protein
MKPLFSFPKAMVATISVASLLNATAPQACADPAEAADRAYLMASKYSNMGFYMTPSKEGHGGLGVTYEFEVPVNRGLDYVFIIAGDQYCQELEIWVEAEETGNTLVKDTRRAPNGLAGVRWRSDYNGTVDVVVHFARVTDRCGWCALVGRRGTVVTPYEGTASTLGGNRPSPADATAKGPD